MLHFLSFSVISERGTHGIHCRNWTLLLELKILIKAVCISQSIDTFGKGINPIFFLPLMSKTGFFYNPGGATGLGEGKLLLKNQF